MPAGLKLHVWHIPFSYPTPITKTPPPSPHHYSLTAPVVNHIIPYQFSPNHIPGLPHKTPYLPEVLLGAGCWP